MNQKLADVLVDLEKVEESGIKLPTSTGSYKKQESSRKTYQKKKKERQREFQKNIYFCFTDNAKVFYLVDHNKLWKILKRWEYKTTLPAF